MTPAARRSASIRSRQSVLPSVPVPTASQRSCHVVPGCSSSQYAELPQMAPRRLSGPDRQRRLGSAGSLLAAEGASAAITVGGLGRAIELLEQARGILLSEAMGARGDLTELRARAPALAVRFERLRDAMDTLEHVGSDPLNDSASARIRARSCGWRPRLRRFARRAEPALRRRQTMPAWHLRHMPYGVFGGRSARACPGPLLGDLEDDAGMHRVGSFHSAFSVGVWRRICCCAWQDAPERQDAITTRNGRYWT